MRTAASLLALAVLAAGAARAGEIPNAVIVLEADPGTPGSDPSGAPPRFVLLRDRQVFVGGTRGLETGRLEKDEARDLEKRAEAVRKLPGIAGPMPFWGDSMRGLRLLFPRDEPREIAITGDPAAAPASMALLASFLSDLMDFYHPSLRPYVPAGYAMKVREGRLDGGCRPWRFVFPIEEALAGPRVLPAADASDWAQGGVPASVCVDDRRYVVTLRPLLPGEQP